VTASAVDVAAAERDRRSSAVPAEALFSWGGAIALLVLVVWLVPVKNYRLPVNLLFSLELYRLLIISYVVVWGYAVAAGRMRVEAGGLGKPIALLAAVGFLSILSNANVIARGHLTSQAVKSLSYFLSFLVAYLLVHSTLRSIESIELVLYALVIGAVLVSLAAFYESRTDYDVFHHLQNWVPLLRPSRAIGETTQHMRGGRLRVEASAQHPIALGAALMTTVPLAFYLGSRAATVVRSRLWIASGLLIAAGAAATVSRTVVLMAAVMVGVGLYLRGRQLVRYWPVLVVLGLALHVAAPGAMRHLYTAFFPRGGLTQQLDSRVGGVGSGRLSDIAPGLRSLQEAPFFGHGLGTGSTRDTNVGDKPGAIVDPRTGAPIIFDDQYMNTLVTMGVLGLVGVVWFVWGGALRLIGTARRSAGRCGDLVAACAVATAGFGAGMLAFDAFSFVQCTLLFFLVMALGLRARALAG
jgi:O-Antigen ligase